MPALIHCRVLFRGGNLSRGHGSCDGREVGFAGAKERQLVDDHDLGRDHQVGGALGSGMSLEGGARGSFLLGDEHQALAAALVGLADDRRGGVGRRSAPRRHRPSTGGRLP